METRPNMPQIALVAFLFTQKNQLPVTLHKYLLCNCSKEQPVMKNMLSVILITSTSTVRFARFLRLAVKLLWKTRRSLVAKDVDDLGPEFSPNGG